MHSWMHKRLHEFSSIFVDLPWLALFLKTPFKNVLKSFDRALLLSCKCIFISKIWKNSWGSYILVGKVIYFSYQNVGSSRIPIRFFFNFYLWKCICMIIRRLHQMISNFWMEFSKIGQVMVNLQRLNWIHAALYALIIWLISGYSNSSTSRLVAPPKQSKIE